jgi:hypothetical protein
MRQELFFVCSIDSDGRGVGRTVFDPLAVDIYVHQFAISRTKRGEIVTRPPGHQYR